MWFLCKTITSSCIAFIHFSFCIWVCASLKLSGFPFPVIVCTWWIPYNWLYKLIWSPFKIFVGCLLGRFISPKILFTLVPLINYISIPYKLSIPKIPKFVPILNHDYNPREYTRCISCQALTFALWVHVQMHCNQTSLSMSRRYFYHSTPSLLFHNLMHKQEIG